MYCITALKFFKKTNNIMKVEWIYSLAIITAPKKKVTSVHLYRIYTWTLSATQPPCLNGWCFFIINYSFGIFWTFYSVFDVMTVKKRNVGTRGRGKNLKPIYMERKLLLYQLSGKLTKYLWG